MVSLQPRRKIKLLQQRSNNEKQFLKFSILEFFNMKEKWLGWILIKFYIFSDGAGGLIYKPFSFY